MTKPIGSYPFCSQPVSPSSLSEDSEDAMELPLTQPDERWIDRVRSHQAGCPLRSSGELPSTQPYEVVSDPLLSGSLEMDEEGEGYCLPILRYPRVSPRCDTAFFTADLKPLSAHGSEERFIEDQYILKKHAMRYIDCGPYPATGKVVAMARNGKYIVWQQAIRSCTAAAISMIALDRGRVFLAQEITYAVASNEKQLRYIHDAGFESVVHSLAGLGVEKAKKLEEIIAESGSGLLHLQHPDLKSHMVVLDEISLDKDRVTLREPYHGYMITVRLFPFINWIGEEFIQLI